MARARTQRSLDIWPGFVDALSTLLLVIIFLLVVFVLAQTFLSYALSGRDQVISRLNQQVNELAELLSLERQANADLRLNVAQLSASLQESTAARDELVLKLDALKRRAEEAERALAEAEKTISADRETIRARLAEIESLKRDITALRDLRRELEGEIALMAAAIEAGKKEVAKLTQSLDESQSRTAELGGELESSRAEIARLLALVAKEKGAREKLAQALKESETRSKDLSQTLESSKARVAELLALLETTKAEKEALAKERDEQSRELGALRDRTKELEARLADEQERTLLAQKDLKKREVRLAELQALYLQTEDRLEEERKAGAKARSRVELLNQQIAALRQQLARIEEMLGAAEAKDRENQAVIKDLGRRLNRALASKVEELSRYRSEFFGRLREVLGKRRDIMIVGDRFVFQSEVLFASGSASLGEEGRAQLAKLARTLMEIAREIPDDLNWILRVDGHTDKVPISTPHFPSNWELSTARAISVTKFLIEQGVPPYRLAATGFGEFQPLDDRDDEIAYRRNRRIELKLTQR